MTMIADNERVQALCDKHAWCDGEEHENGRNPSGSHHTRVTIDEWDDGAPRRMAFSLYEPTPEFDEPEHMMIGLDFSHDFSVLPADCDKEIDAEIRYLNRARAVARMFLGSIGRGPEVTVGQMAELARAAGWKPSELFKFEVTR